MGDVMELLKSNLSRVRIPKPTSRIYKQECCISFDNPKSEGGLYIDMNFYLAFGKDHVMWNYEKTGNPIYLHIKQSQKMAPEEGTIEKPTLLASGTEGGFIENESEYEETHSIVILPDFVTLAVPSVELPEKVRLAVDFILMAKGSERKEHVASEVADGKQVSTYAKNLLQIDNGIVVPPSGWQCAKCDETKNLWLNLTDGMILCGGRNLNKNSGKNHAVEHYNKSGYPLAVKLETLTPELKSADVYSFVEGVSVMDHLIEQHLAFFGIDCSTFQKAQEDAFDYGYNLRICCGSWEPKPMLHSLSELHRAILFESAIRAAVSFWDKEDHLFRFGDQELVLLPSEFDGFLELHNGVEPVMPRGEACTQHCVTELLEFDDETAGIFCRSKGILSLKDLWYHITRTETSLQTRRRVATMCLLGHYLFRMPGCCASFDVADIVSQLEQGKSLGCLIVAEIIESLDRWATPETSDSFFSGSILLLQYWLFDHLKIHKDDFAGPRYTPASMLTVKLPTVPEQGWKAFFEGIQIGAQIRWVMPWWQAQSDVVQSEGYAGVILAGLRNYHIIYPWRGMRQFGDKQVIPVYKEPEFSRPVYDRSVVREILRAWKNGIQWGIRRLQDDWVELSEECQRWVIRRHMRIFTRPYDPLGVPPSRIGQVILACSEAIVRSTMKERRLMERKKKNKRRNEKNKEIKKNKKKLMKKKEVEEMTPVV